MTNRKLIKYLYDIFKDDFKHCLYIYIFILIYDTTTVQLKRHLLYFVLSTFKITDKAKIEKHRCLGTYNNIPNIIISLSPGDKLTLPNLSRSYYDIKQQSILCTYIDKIKIIFEYF